MSPLPPDEFWAFFEEKGRFPDGSYIAARGYRSQRQKDLKYQQYLRSAEKKAVPVERRPVRRAPIKTKPDELWESVRQQVWARDKSVCRLMRVLVPFEQAQLISNSGGVHKQLDCAHVRPKSTSIALKYDVNNVVLLNRFSHSCLDTGRDPVSGRKITPAEVEDWWQRILKGCEKGARDGEKKS